LGGFAGISLEVEHGNGREEIAEDLVTKHGLDINSWAYGLEK
jgi:hypothetical protein